MSRYRCRRRDAIAGFSLVEALVATLLMGMILTALGAVTAQWLPGWDHGASRLQRTELLSAGLQRMTDDLAAAEFISPNGTTAHPLFDGSELSVTFVRTAIGPNTRGGLEVIRISETADQNGPVVVRTRAPFAPNDTALDHLNFSDPVALLHAPYRLTFAYAGRDKVWKSGWHGEELLPQAVRLTIRDDATDRTLAVSSAITIHAELPADCVGPKKAAYCGEDASMKTAADTNSPIDGSRR